KDEDGIPKHCHRRSTSGSFKQTESGSQAEHSFHHDGESEWLFGFEAPIDLLAFLSLHRDNWQKHSYVALCSVSERAVLHRLKVNLKLNKIVLCLDNDEAGRNAAYRIRQQLYDLGYKNTKILTPQNKDWDEDLKLYRRENHT
ncbi:MAG: toprim domain-containing protein, partial [Clostridia bacterium]|nr:toprim domain-containing protein [Clostridia bacterium]